jgi:magnesium chelatase subunit I
MDKSEIPIFPYHLIVGQEQLKLALELACIAPRIGGVLLSGERGTGKSTAVRAFAYMMYGGLPVTLPINATEDRVIGGWEINELMQGKAEWQDGLLVEANKKVLYVDEVNLLDDHIVNIILDVTSTGVLVIQREGKSTQKSVSFTLIGTMNPEEGGLRPQLLDRFGLMVNITAQTTQKQRIRILETVMDWDEALYRLSRDLSSDFIGKAQKKDHELCYQLSRAREDFHKVTISRQVVESCVKLTQEFKIEGNRGDYLIALAARAYAALQGAKQVIIKDVEAVARLIVQHRRPEVLQSNQMPWSEKDDELITQILYGD